MRSISLIECNFVAGGSTTSSETIYVDLAPPSSEEKLALVMTAGTLLGGFGGFVFGVTYISSTVGVVGCTALGAAAGMFGVPFVVYGVANAIYNGFNAVKHLYI